MSSTIGPRTVTRHRIGREQRPVSIVDGFTADIEALRRAALQATFGPAGDHYPGIRAPLPPGYLAAQLPVVAEAMGRTFGRIRRLRVIDVSFSIVTTPPSALHPRQRLPHVDAYGADRIAFVQYLGLDDHDGTAFYRHRTTGYETIDDTRAPAYFDAVDRELKEHAPPPGYIAGDTRTHECIERIDARCNRAIVYHSHALHSGAIAAGASLSNDPAQGRLTVTGFLAIE